jgi:hypothetical protein
MISSREYILTTSVGHLDVCNGHIATREFPTLPNGLHYECQIKAWFDEAMMLVWVGDVLAPYVATVPREIIKSIVIIRPVERKMPWEKTYLARHCAIADYVSSNNILFNHTSSIEDYGLHLEPYLGSWHELNPAVASVFVTLLPPGTMLNPNNINHSTHQTFD